MQQNPVLFHLSNLLIISGLLLFAYIYFPVAMIYLNPPKIEAQIETKITEPDQYYLTIPKIFAQGPVINNVDPWDKTKYEGALQQGIAHVQGTAYPGNPGITYLFAHSSEQVWKITRYNTIFFRLAELNAGDQVLISTKDKTLEYEVTGKVEVWPEQVEYLKTALSPTGTEDYQLILQTCTPIGTDLKRLLVFAKLKI